MMIFSYGCPIMAPRVLWLRATLLRALVLHQNHLSLTHTKIMTSLKDEPIIRPCKLPGRATLAEMAANRRHLWRCLTLQLVSSPKHPSSLTWNFWTRLFLRCKLTFPGSEKINLYYIFMLFIVIYQRIKVLVLNGIDIQTYVKWKF